MAETLKLWQTRRFWLTALAILLIALVFLVIRGDGTPRPSVEAPPAAATPR